MEETKELTLPEQARDQAKNYFRQGLNCTECTAYIALGRAAGDDPFIPTDKAAGVAGLWVCLVSG